MVIVAKIHSHGAELHAFAAQGHAGQQTHIGERAVVIVVPEIGRDTVVGDKQVRPAVVVVVGPDHPEAAITDVVLDHALLRHLLKLAVTAPAAATGGSCP